MDKLALGAHAWSAAVAGPALLWAAWSSEGTLKSRLMLAGIGTVLIASNLPFLTSEVKNLLPGDTSSVTG